MADTHHFNSSIYDFRQLVGLLQNKSTESYLLHECMFQFISSSITRELVESIVLTLMR